MADITIDRAAIIGAPTKDGLRWCEAPAAFGLRFVGWADELARGINHSGWYGDDDGENGQTYRGAVYQLAARKGRPRYVAGYREGELGHHSKEWSDLSGVEAANLDLGRIFLGDPDIDARSPYGGTDCDGARKAAYAADRLAEREAESAREYNRAWQAGARYADLGAALNDARKKALRLLLERRTICERFGDTVKAAGDTIAATVAGIDETIAAAVSQVEKLRRERVALRDEWTPSEHERRTSWRADEYAAFSDGAQMGGHNHGLSIKRRSRALRL